MCGDSNSARRLSQALVFVPCAALGLAVAVACAAQGASPSQINPPKAGCALLPSRGQLAADYRPFKAADGSWRYTADPLYFTEDDRLRAEIQIDQKYGQIGQALELESLLNRRELLEAQQKAASDAAVEGEREIAVERLPILQTAEAMVETFRPKASGLSWRVVDGVDGHSNIRVDLYDNNTGRLVIMYTFGESGAVLGLSPLEQMRAKMLSCAQSGVYQTYVESLTRAKEMMLQSIVGTVHGKPTSLIPVMGQPALQSDPNTPTYSSFSVNAGEMTLVVSPGGAKYVVDRVQGRNIRLTDDYFPPSYIPPAIKEMD